LETLEERNNVEEDMRYRVCAALERNEGRMNLIYNFLIKG